MTKSVYEIFLYCSREKLKVYMFIDEYDNFTNTILDDQNFLTILYLINAKIIMMMMMMMMMMILVL